MPSAAYVNGIRTQILDNFNTCYLNTHLLSLRTKKGFINVVLNKLAMLLCVLKCVTIFSTASFFLKKTLYLKKPAVFFIWKPNSKLDLHLTKEIHVLKLQSGGWPLIHMGWLEMLLRNTTLSKRTQHQVGVFPRQPVSVDNLQWKILISVPTLSYFLDLLTFPSSDYCHLTLQFSSKLWFER